MPKQQPGEFSQGYLETVCCYRKAANQLLDRDIFVMHASVVALDGEGYAFLAPSGVGKTTQTRLWQQHFGQRLRVIYNNMDHSMLTAFRAVDCILTGGTDKTAIWNVILFLDKTI